MRKLKLYIETSVWDFLFADDAPEKRYITERLFKEIASGRYEIYISEVVEREIEKAPREIRKRLAGVIEKYQPFVLEDDPESRKLVYNYVENGLLSEGQLADLLHVGIGTINEMDIIVSWNLKHIVRMKTRTMVNEINHFCGYRGIEICTPKEVLEYDE
jgi:hypothetical protein